MKKNLIALHLFIISLTVSADDGEIITYDVAGKPYEGYFISPSNDAPLIILFHDWDGLTDYEIERANMLAEWGYAVFAADLFGKGIRPTAVKDKRQHTGELYQDRDKMRSLMKAALDIAESKGGHIENAVAMGYCFGGATTLEFARSGIDLKGFVSFHGGLKTPKGQNYKETKGDVLILHGSADSIITMNQFAQLANELEAQQIPHEMISYSGAPHGFTVFQSSSYQEQADRKSWNRFIDFLNEVLE